MLDHFIYQFKKYFFVFLCIICANITHELYGQKSSKDAEAEEAFSKRDYPKAEKLWKEIAIQSAKENNIEKEIDALLNIVRVGMHISKYDTSKYYTRLAAEKAKKHNLPLKYGSAMNTMSTVFEFLDLKDSIIYAANEVINTPGLGHNYYSDSYTSLSYVYRDKGDLENEEIHLNKAIEIDRMHNDSSSLPFNLLHLGAFKSSLNLHNEGLLLYFEALSFLRPKKDKFKYPTIYCNISSLFRTLQNLEKSEEYGLKALEVCNNLNLKTTKVRAFNELGATAQKGKNYRKALNYYLKSDSIHIKKGGRLTYQLDVKISIGECLLKLNELEKVGQLIKEIKPQVDSVAYNIEKLGFAVLDAEYTFKTNPNIALPKIQKADRIAKTLKNRYSTNKIFGLYAEYYAFRKDYKNSLIFSEKAERAKDSIYRSEQSFVVHNLEALYQKKEQDVQIELLATQNELQSSQLKQQKIIIFSSIVGLIIFGTLLSFIASLFGKVKSQKTVVEKSLEEKNVLLKEIHHRVKNNLQVISSLLALQSKYIKDDNALIALQQGQDRVHSMALIHQDLYQGGNLIGVSTSNYFEQLIDNLIYSYNIEEEEVSLLLDIEDITLDVDTMIPLGLVVNELVSNAFKHAFNDNHQNAEIKISLKEKNNYLILEVKDNGESIKSTDEINDKSFGFELIKAFSAKLKAKLEMDIDGGLSIKLLIENYNKAA